MKKLKHIKMFEQLSSALPSDFTTDQIKNMTEEEFFMNADKYLKEENADQLESLIKIWMRSHREVWENNVEWFTKLNPYTDFFNKIKDYEALDKLQKEINRERKNLKMKDLMYACPIDMGHDDEPVGDWLKDMDRILKQYNLTIIGLKPMGPAGGNMEITFKGKYSDIELMVSTEMPDADLEDVMSPAMVYSLYRSSSDSHIESAKSTIKRMGF